MVNTTSPYVCVDFNNVVAPWNSRLQVARSSTKSSCAHDCHLSGLWPKSIAFIHAFRQVLVPVKAQRHSGIYKHLYYFNVQIVVLRRSTNQVVMPCRCGQPASAMWIPQRAARALDSSGM